MITKKFSLLILLALLFSLTAGCSAYRGERSFTSVGGIYERQVMGYERVPTSTINLRRSEIDPGAELSGNQTSILWGLFTYSDY